ncbi:MAG: glycosyltransferase family protein [Butyrivibrio sp.]|nr:glycosyltransferase family protein [Muribaculum sp.]MCM1551371.1 glycosyltransferase family protein [Butyrivibrio sp.]
MNDKKIAFITCVNNETVYEECKYYLNRLSVPTGYETDVIAVTEAPSMTAGYNAGMQSSDARYKVYLHQDVMIVNSRFLFDLLNVFASDPEIGLLGMIGARRLDDHARAITNWDTGKVLHNCTPSRLEYEMASGTLCQEVEAIDGLLIATQEDVPWREDLFDGWHYYDISQCMEFMRIGRKIVVPYQEEPWVWHDNAYSKMQDYYRYVDLFIREYGDLHAFVKAPVPEPVQEFNELKERTRSEMFGLIDRGFRKELVELFRNPTNRGYLYLKEIQMIADIEGLETAEGTTQRLWRESSDTHTLLEDLRRLKYLLKRVEFGTEPSEPLLQAIRSEYSPYAEQVVREAYRFKS